MFIKKSKITLRVLLKKRLLIYFYNIDSQYLGILGVRKVKCDEM